MSFTLESLSPILRVPTKLSVVISIERRSQRAERISNNEMQSPDCHTKNLPHMGIVNRNVE